MSSQVSKQSDSATSIKQSAASRILLKKVDKMVSNLDKVLVELEKKEATIQADIQKVAEVVDDKKTELVRIDELIAAIRRVSYAVIFLYFDDDNENLLDNW